MIHKLAFIVLVVGGLNWLVLALSGWEIGQLFGGQEALISRGIYVFVGIAALYEVFTHRGTCKECSA